MSLSGVVTIYIHPDYPDEFAADLAKELRYAEFRTASGEKWSLSQISIARDTEERVEGLMSRNHGRHTEDSVYGMSEDTKSLLMQRFTGVHAKWYPECDPDSGLPMADEAYYRQAAERIVEGIESGEISDTNLLRIALVRAPGEPGAMRVRVEQRLGHPINLPSR